MNAYMNVYASMMNLMVKFKAAHPEFNLGDIQDFDSLDTAQLPAGNLAGIYQLDYSEKGSLIYAQCAFPISTELDVASEQLYKASGLFAKSITMDTIHPFYDYDSENIIGNMKAKDSLAISPIIRTTNRQFKITLQGFVFDRTSAYLPQ